jgi:hypothetical protein
MLSSKDFRSLIAVPAAEQYKKEPASLLHAYAVVWALDAYASHVFQEITPGSAIDKDPKREEEKFKNRLLDRTRQGAWQFQVVRAVSNAGKHGKRSKVELGIKDSGALSIQRIDGWLHYFMGPYKQLWGEQVIVELGLVYDKEKKAWLLDNGEAFVGPLTNWVSVYELITPTLALLDSESRAPTL